MAEPTLPEAGRVQAGMIAALLEQGRPVHAVALVVQAVTLGLAALLAGSGKLDLIAAALLGSGSLAGLAGTVMAMRIGFDARLFAALGRGTFGLGAMDEALVGLALMPALKAGRPLAPRIAGALRLMQLQRWLLALQGTLLAAALFLLMIRA